MGYMEVSVAKGALTLWGQLDLAERAAADDAVIVDGRLMEGNIDAFSASWTLTLLDGGARTCVDFRIYIDTSRSLWRCSVARTSERLEGRSERCELACLTGHTDRPEVCG